MMQRPLSRTVAAFGLVAAVWTNSLVALAAPQQQQQQQPQPPPVPTTTTPAPTTRPQQPRGNQQPQRAAQNNTGTNAQTPATPATASAQRPLAKDEDPRLIGKRNINGGRGVVGFFGQQRGPESEMALGRQLAAEIDQQAKFVTDPVITEYVNRVGQNIVLHSDAKVPFTIKVLDSDEPNAFALPGGFFYVNKGLLLAADNEAELAGVMAHEIAHVAARHAVEMEAKSNAINLGVLAGSILLGGAGAMVLQNAGGFGIGALFAKYNRNAEEEADKLAAQYLWAAGYDPNAMATMFEKLNAMNKKTPGKLARIFASHPQPPNRRAKSVSLVARFPERDEYVISSSEFQRVKARMMRLSNARATSKGALAGANDDGAPGRPTLKRRQPAPDASGGTTAPNADGTAQPTAPPDRPTLQRRAPETSPSPTTSTPPPTTNAPTTP